ncbi:MFS transporter [Acinetobacter baumannii]
MGCIPTFHQIGYWAPTLLVILRLIQGFAFGGEWGGAVILVSEHSPDDRRGYWASYCTNWRTARKFSSHTGFIITFKNLSPEQFLDWGWRCAFWFSAVVVLIGLWIRKM